VSVPQDSGTFYTRTQGHWFLDAMAKRAPGADFPTTEYAVSTDTYACVQWAQSEPIPVEVRANSQIPMELETLSVQHLGQLSMLRKEIQFVSDFIAASVWTTQDNDSATDWDDYVSGDPVSNVRTGRRGINQLTGMRPNTFAVGEIVHDALANHPDIIDRIKYTAMATASTIENALAAVFGVDRYLVAEAIYNSSNPAQNASYSAIFDDDALLCYVSPSPGLFSATAGLTFTWAGGGGDGSIYRYFSNEKHADIVQIKESWDQKQIGAGLGAIWLGIV